MTLPATTETAARYVLLLLDRRNRIWVPTGETARPSAEGPVDDGAAAASCAQRDCELQAPVYELDRKTFDNSFTAFLVAFASDGALDGGRFLSLEALGRALDADAIRASPRFAEAVEAVERNLLRLPYLDLSENDYIYRFRTAKERNRSVYIDEQSQALYQSELCEAIKGARRVKEKSSGEPAELDFGPVRYVLPSHFGFCLGVQNAIERAYETVAANPGRRVYMLSELIHNPFVNEDLLARGLRYLQTDKGVPLRDDGAPAEGPDDPAALWNRLDDDDIVIIPAFGATDEDKVRLIRRGIDVRSNDATCMLVEKVWKAARRYAREGFTVLIHGKAEHEETKATFSNAARHGPALIVRNMEHARALGDVIAGEDPRRFERFHQAFDGLYSAGFDAERDLRRIAVVNQTTLLRNATLEIMDYLREVFALRYGEDRVEEHLWTKGRGDTLCYATQVNQDALERALEMDLDAAIVVGGKNSSNTYQLFRMCADRFGERAFYIQSENDILGPGAIRHSGFGSPGNGQAPPPAEERPFLAEAGDPRRILLTGGASCPDGIIQQVIRRINALFPPEQLRDVSDVAADFAEA